MTGAEEKIDVPHFDPVEHAARHRGIEAVTRLFELAKNATDQGLQRAAVSRGLELALKLPWSHHHDKLVSVAEALGLAEAEGEAARAVEEARASHERRMRDLDEEVQGANASLSKPRIFVRGRSSGIRWPGAGGRADAASHPPQAAYRAMAEACAAAGDHHAAIKAYFTLKNHCSNPEEFAVLCRGIVVMSLQTRTHGHVATFSLRGRSSVGEDAERCACGRAADRVCGPHCRATLQLPIRVCLRPGPRVAIQWRLYGCVEQLFPHFPRLERSLCRGTRKPGRAGGPRVGAHRPLGHRWFSARTWRFTGR